MVTIFLIHGAYGNPNENWFPWLSEKLQELGHKVIIPKFPTPENQKLENWLDVFNKYSKDVDKNTLFIGHSIGVAFILNLLEKYKIKAGLFVSGFCEKIDLQAFDEINETFLKDFDWNKIRLNCKKFVVYHSDNDPYVPLDYGKKLSKNLKVRLSLISGAGHFNEKSGYLHFPDILEQIKRLSK
ncbi:MAG: RBBP9/YdeN family alpha/beta hydrolase [Candidatus Woesearchaeota archaeon]